MARVAACPVARARRGAGRRAGHPRATAASAIPAPCPPRPSGAGRHGGRRAPSRLLRVGTTRHAKPGAPAAPLELPALGTGRHAAPGFINASRAPLPRSLESSAPRKGGDDARHRRRQRPLAPSRTAWRTPFGRGVRKRRGECATRHRAAIRKRAVRLAQRRHDGLGRLRGRPDPPDGRRQPRRLGGRRNQRRRHGDGRREPSQGFAFSVLPAAALTATEDGGHALTGWTLSVGRACAGGTATTTFGLRPAAA